MTKPSADELLVKPSAEELEVSVFGPGIGECVVVHVGAGQWMIIDSCLDPDTRRPVALEYLESLGVDPSRDVVTVLITHWHDDHTRGARQVLEACCQAEFFCSSAMNRREFFQLIEAAGQLELRTHKGSGIDEMRAIFDVLRAGSGPGSARIASPRYASANRVIYRRASGSVRIPV